MAKPLTSLSDAYLEAVATQVITTISGTPANYGMLPADVTALTNANSSFTDAMADQLDKQQQAQAATITKETARDALTVLLRSFRDKAKAHGTSDADIKATGIPQGATQTAPPNATVPVASVDTSRRLQHNISWAEAATPDNKKRPRGVMGADIYCKIDGPPPTDESQCTFVTTDSATPYLVEYTGDDAGKMAHYMLRWRFSDGGVGPWGETVSATVTG